VTSVEIHPRRAAEARAKLARQGITGASVEVGDGARGYGSAIYNVIVLTGSTPILAEAFAARLAPGGRLFAVVGEPPVMKARLVRWTAPGAPVPTDLFETVVPPLINAPEPARFTF
jgi:protein-L-isoaspartate(D-aspartate) O-methyltransferase